MQLINDYRELVNQQIPLSSDWEEELNHLIYVRDLLHQEATDSYASEVKKIDRKWQSQLLSTNTEVYKLDIDRSQHPKFQWWWWIDSLDELSEEERSTL